MRRCSAAGTSCDETAVAAFAIPVTYEDGVPSHFRFILACAFHAYRISLYEMGYQRLSDEEAICWEILNS